MVTKSRNPRPPEAPKAPARKRVKKTHARYGNTTLMREQFVLEYLVDRNGTQAAIRAGASPYSAHATASRWLKREDIRAAIAKHQAAVLAPLIDRYEAKSEQIVRELALLGFSNIADFIRIDDDGEAAIDLSDATRDHFAAVQSIKTKRSTRYVGETSIEDVTTELKLAPKREALSELARIRGLLKDGGDVLLPVRFIVNWGPGPKPEPYPDEVIEGRAP